MLSDQPTFEVRGVRLPLANESPVHIWYRHYYAGDDIDLIAVTNR